MDLEDEEALEVDLAEGEVQEDAAAQDSVSFLIDLHKNFFHT